MGRGTAVVLMLLCSGLAACSQADKPSDAEQPPPSAAHSLAAAPTETKELDDDALANLYVKWSARLEKDPRALKGSGFGPARRDLMQVTNHAKDGHLRANGALLLGAIYELRGDLKQSISFYRRALKLVDDDAGPAMALAVALAADNQFAEAAQVQRTATRLDPNNLENWLALGELLFKAGDKTASAAAYVDYERVRKRLIDGLTARSGGVYIVPPPERVGCAEALAAVPDQGTAVALALALSSDPDATVREAAARVMGIHRLELYRKGLEHHLSVEKDTATLESTAWALGEIGRDPVVIAPNTPEPAVPSGTVASKESETKESETKESETKDSETKDSEAKDSAASKRVP